MAEGGQGTAILAEGNNIEQSIEGGNINVVAGAQIRGNQYNVTANTGQDQIERQGQPGSATLAEGDRIDQRFRDCNVNVVGRDQIHGNVINYYITHGANVPNQDTFQPCSEISKSENNECRGSDSAASRPDPESSDSPALSPTTENVLVRPTNTSVLSNLWEKITGKYSEGFIKKLNVYSWNNIQGGIVDNYEDLTDPDKEFYPRIKTGFKLFKGDYVPQEGFSAHCQPKKGRYVDFSECLNILQEPNKNPSMIIGQPGSGKTIMMKRLAKALLIANRVHEQNLSRRYQRFFRIFRRRNETTGYDVVLHMNIRDIPNTSSGSLAEVIFNMDVLGITMQEAQFGLKAILKNELRIIMFFDGLDQASWEPACVKKVGPWEKASTATIFSNILCGHLLSHVSIMVSSREHSVARLPQEMRPQFISALVGFSEQDAKNLYCLIMGDGADVDWETMRNSNPAMHYMCLTPLFLIFYMITKKRNPEDPPDCATAVMVSIIQIFLECENSRRIGNKEDVALLLRKLKKMAFQGTKEQRVVFDKEDLKRFELLYENISDIVIQVPGFSILGQKILEGMYRFFFSHQTLQEILSALFVVELDYEEFQNVVNDDFPKSYWCVVRSFTSGILKNEKVRCRISKLIFNSSDSTKKCEYLMTHLRQQLRLNRPPADKLEAFVALKEANALDVLCGFTEDLNFSNSPLTPAMINTLCSVMKYVGEVGCLSLANSGMDDEMLEVLAKGTDGLGIKVG